MSSVGIQHTFVSFELVECLESCGIVNVIGAECHPIEAPIRDDRWAPIVVALVAADLGHLGVKDADVIVRQLDIVAVGVWKAAGRIKHSYYRAMFSGASSTCKA